MARNLPSIQRASVSKVPHLNHNLTVSFFPFSVKKLKTENPCCLCSSF